MTKEAIQNKSQLFEIPTSVWETLDFDVVQDTYSEMFEAGLVHPPFFLFSIRIPIRGFLNALSSYCKSKGDEEINLTGFYKAIGASSDEVIIVHFRFRKLFVDYQYLYQVDVGEGNDAINFGLITGVERKFEDEFVSFIYKCFTVLLATKNTGKRVVENSPRAGSKKARDDSARYATTTYISIGKITETMRGSSGQRGAVRAHLRRGHVRRQRVGQGLSEEKIVFIAPVFVNADQEWVSERRKYKLVG